jgi:hypothetical protein
MSLPAGLQGQDDLPVSSILLEPWIKHLAASSGRMPLETPGTAPATTRDEGTRADQSRVRNPRLDEGRDRAPQPTCCYQIAEQESDGEPIVLSQLVRSERLGTADQAELSFPIAAEHQP